MTSEINATEAAGEASAASAEPPVPQHPRWPEPGQHLFGPWMNHTSTPTVRKQYRQCAHPACPAFELREAARA